MNYFLLIIFRLHDFARHFIAGHLFLIKRFILVMAYLSLFLILFPEMRRGIGNAAEAMLLFILFLSPLSKIFRMKLLLQLMGLRRELGILMGCLALAHGITYFIIPVAFSFDIEPYLNASFFSMQPLYYFGILSLLFTLPLFLTSNSFSLRILGGEKWKMLHRIVYALLLIVLVHVFFVRSMRRGYNMGELIQPASIIFSYVLLKVLAWKNFIAPLRDATQSVSERYGEYVVAKNEVSVPMVS